MKKKVIALCAGLCLLLNSCNLISTDRSLLVDNIISEVDSDKASDYIVKSFHFDKGMDNIICVKEENIIYTCYENKDTALAFYKYCIKENKTYRIGKIDHPYINSGDIAEVENNLYFYCNEVSYRNENSEGQLNNSLYRIDIDGNTLEKVANDATEQTLIYLDAADRNVISLKGNINGNKGITYLDKIEAFNGEDSAFDSLLSKEYDRQNNTGEVIYNFSVYNDFIYAIVLQRASEDNVSWIIEKYNMEGNQIGKINLDAQIMKLIDGERISKFEVFGSYAFIRTFSGTGALFTVSSDTTNTKLIKDTDFDIAMAAKTGPYIILYSRDNGEMWRLEINTNTLFKLDLPYEYFNFVYLDENNKALISSDEIIYTEIDKIPIKEQMES